MFSGLYSNASGFVDTTPFFDNWVPGPSDPLQSKVEALITFCYPDASLSVPGSQDMEGFEKVKSILTGENIKHLLEEYKNFHSHWPMIHMPTFNPINADHGLVLAMICVGAIYSDRLALKEVSWLMRLVKTSVYRSSHIYRLISEDSKEFLNIDSASSSLLEEVQALVLIQTLFIWHGSQMQRQKGRDEFWVLVQIARQLDLLHPISSGHGNFSVLHQAGPLEGTEVNTWTWTAWVEQEKRARTMYLIWLIDAAITIFFNVQPRFDAYEVKLPLPADDDAWEAKSQQDCASALGLRGEAAQVKNTTGSKRAKQIGMCEALHLLHHGADFPQRATNVYSKFILVHAIHVQIYNVQYQILSLNSQSSYGGFTSSGATTPQSTEGTRSNGNSGRGTPVEGVNNQYSQAHQKLRLTVSALEVWKRIWDADMQVQYSPSQQRVGFCRDGIHFYYLARIFLRSSRREDWAAQADYRCLQVFNLLKQIRTHVATDSAQKGLDMGSVTSVDDSYGIADLTLNMKHLFTPVNRATHQN